MPHAKALYDWDRRVATRFPELPRARRRWLALASFGIALAECALLTAVALKLAAALGRAPNAARQRLRKLYRDPGFDVTACFGPLVRWATAGFEDRRLAPAVDPTNLGDRFTALTVSVVFRSCAVPVAWQVLRADQKGSWNDHWKRLLGALRGALGEGWQVLVLSDRGLESKALFGAVVGLGWHPLMRAKRAGHFRPDGWRRGWAMGRFAGRVGANWKGAGVAWPGGGRLGCTLLARWEAGHAEPWLVLTDLAPADASAAWYAMRSWIEAGFRDLKSDGWQVARTRMADPGRVGRWWAACALASLWALESGQEAERLDIPACRGGRPPSGRPAVSLFALGLAWLVVRLGRGRVGRLRPLAQPPWPADGRAIDPLDEQEWMAEHQTVPL
jgi:DDE family transposase